MMQVNLYEITLESNMYGDYTIPLVASDFETALKTAQVMIEGFNAKSNMPRRFKGIVLKHENVWHALVLKS